MTCFFDASHGPGSLQISWSPQWGAPRPVLACPACSQRWTDYLQGRNSGYPQSGGYPQPGYPQPGYPQPGYPQPGYGYPQDYPHQHGYGVGTVAAAGAAGFVGGMIVNEVFDNDEVIVEHEVIEHVDVVEEVDVVEVVEEDYGNGYGGDYGNYSSDW